MKEEKTQGIHTETTTKDSYDTNKKAKETELLDLRAGYFQHTSPIFVEVEVRSCLAQLLLSGCLHFDYLGLVGLWFLGGCDS